MKKNLLILLFVMIFTAPLMSGEEIFITEEPEPVCWIHESLLQFPVNQYEKIPDEVVSEKLLQFGAQSLYRNYMKYDFVLLSEFEIMGRKYLLYRYEFFPETYYNIADITEDCGYPPTLELLQDIADYSDRWFEYDGKNMLTIYNLVYMDPGWTTLKTYKYEFTESGLKLVEKMEERPSISPEEHQLRVYDWKIITLDKDSFKK